MTEESSTGRQFMEPEISEYEVSVTAIIEASSGEEARKYFRRWLAAGSSRDPRVIAGWAVREREA